MTTRNDICPTCGQPGGIMMFHLVGPCMKCQPDGSSPPVQTDQTKGKIPPNWTHARWVNNKGGELGWETRAYIEENGKYDRGMKGTWGQLLDGDIEFVDGSTIWTIEFR